MSRFTQLVVFRLDEQRYALPMRGVERILRAAEVTRLPKAPAIMLGVINLDGRVLPVLNIRSRLGLPECEIRPADHFLIAQTVRRTVVLVIDEALGVIERPPGDIVGRAILPGLEQTRGVIRLDDGLALIHDLEGFLSLGEERALDKAIIRGRLARSSALPDTRKSELCKFIAKSKGLATRARRPMVLGGYNQQVLWLTKERSERLMLEARTRLGSRRQS